jgi:uncharacterized protein
MWLSDLFKSSRERRFFEILIHQASLLDEAAAMLVRYVESGDDSCAQQIAALDRASTEALKQLISAMRDTFVTPIDRTDLYNLGETIDDMLDYLNSAAAEIKVFEVEATPAMRAMCARLREAASQVLAGVRALPSDPSQAYACARSASDAEDAIESQYRSALAELFKGDDVRQMLRLREVYRHFSNSADRADAIGKLIGKVVVKNS